MDCDIRAYLRRANALRRFIEIAVGAMLVVAGVAKLGQRYDFLANIYQYRLVGSATGIWVATYLPWLECVVGCALVSNTFARGGLVMSCILFAVLLAAKISLLARGMAVPCGCIFRESQEPVTITDAALTGIWLLASFGCLLRASQTGRSR